MAASSAVVKVASLGYSLFALGLAAFLVESRPTLVPRSESSSIYGTVLDTLAFDTDTIVLADSTIEVFAEPARTLIGVTAGRPIRFVTARDLRGPRHGDYWAWFHKAHPHAYGWYALSAAMYHGHDRATVAFEHHCGWLCGGGGTVELKRRHGRWVVDEIKTVWVS